MKIGDRVEACGRCFEYYNIVPGASGTIIGKPINYIDETLIAAVQNGYYNKVEGVKTDMNCKYNRNTVNPLEIKNVYFNDPVTVVMWNDGTKTIVRCSENDFYDPEKGLAMAIVKKAYGNDNKFHKIFKKWLPKEDDSEPENLEEFYTIVKRILFGKE